MPEEIVILALVSIIAGTVLLLKISRMLFSYLRDRASGHTGSGDSLTSSELESMLLRVSREANAPILQRIEKLERMLDSKEGAARLPSASQTMLLDEPDHPQDLAGITSDRFRRSVS